MIDVPATAMVLAAGLGTRLRPLTERVPKPLIEVAGRSLLDRCLDRLVEAGVKRAVVNIHWLGGQIRDHLTSRSDIEVVISDESDLLLETGGGIAKALPLLGDAPFYSVNADVIWRDQKGGSGSLRQLAIAFDLEAMDGLLLLQPRERAIGHDGPGDFNLAASGQVVRRGANPAAGFVYTGVQLLQPRLLADAPPGPFSLNLLYDRAIAAGRLYGLTHLGTWMDVGTPSGLATAETILHDEPA
ncbi:MAG TPA: nucleotidyltransferase family protein [Ferrovibrio sp.]|jgi:MurNAc alpha-1-phosphate uridylyltransferase|uniref:nucleotidyltransferase family protein n=1 Tax=Ferrovibrio sp. TaxID=1917215 RepID=UPI002ED1C9A0